MIISTRNVTIFQEEGKTVIVYSGGNFIWTAILDNDGTPIIRGVRLIQGSQN